MYHCKNRKNRLRKQQIVKIYPYYYKFCYCMDTKNKKKKLSKKNSEQSSATMIQTKPLNNSLFPT